MTGVIFISLITLLIKSSDSPEATDQKPSLFVEKNKWVLDPGRISSKRLKKHVSKVIIFDTVVEEACDKESCINVLYEDTFYPELEDIKENFIISTKGTIFEARGFERESEVRLGFEFDDLIDSDAICE